MTNSKIPQTYGETSNGKAQKTDYSVGDGFHDATTLHKVAYIVPIVAVASEIAGAHHAHEAAAGARKAIADAQAVADVGGVVPNAQAAKDPGRTR